MEIRWLLEEVVKGVKTRRLQYLRWRDPVTGVAEWADIPEVIEHREPKDADIR